MRILHALYGLRESNRLFSLEMASILIAAGFLSTPSDPQLFYKFSPRDSGLRCYACVTIDDVLVLTNSPPMRDALFGALTARFGPSTIILVSTVHTGIEIKTLPNCGVLLTQDQAIARAASLVGVSKLPPVLLPYDSQFFSSVVGAEALSIAPTVYSSLTGKLVQFLKTRHDVRLLVSYLCSFNNSPLEGHYRRAIHVLRYLASSPGIGCLYYSVDLAFIVFTDSAFALLRSHGLSSTANIFCLGRYAAPFAAIARFQTDVATCPMTAEYFASGSACKAIQYFRQL